MLINGLNVTPMYVRAYILHITYYLDYYIKAKELLL